MSDSTRQSYNDCRAQIPGRRSFSGRGSSSPHQSAPISEWATTAENSFVQYAMTTSAAKAAQQQQRQQQQQQNQHHNSSIAWLQQPYSSGSSRGDNHSHHVSYMPTMDSGSPSDSHMAILRSSSFTSGHAHRKSPGHEYNEFQQFQQQQEQQQHKHQYQYQHQQIAGSSWHIGAQTSRPDLPPLAAPAAQSRRVSMDVQAAATSRRVSMDCAAPAAAASRRVSMDCAAAAAAASHRANYDAATAAAVNRRVSIDVAAAAAADRRNNIGMAAAAHHRASMDVAAAAAAASRRFSLDAAVAAANRAARNNNAWLKSSLYSVPDVSSENGSSSNPNSNAQLPTCGPFAAASSSADAAAAAGGFSAAPEQGYGAGFDAGYHAGLKASQCRSANSAAVAAYSSGGSSGGSSGSYPHTRSHDGKAVAAEQHQRSPFAHPAWHHPPVQREDSGSSSCSSGMSCFSREQQRQQRQQQQCVDGYGHATGNTSRSRQDCMPYDGCAEESQQQQQQQHSRSRSPVTAAAAANAHDQAAAQSAIAVMKQELQHLQHLRKQLDAAMATAPAGSAAAAACEAAAVKHETAMRQAKAALAAIEAESAAVSGGGGGAAAGSCGLAQSPSGGMDRVSLHAGRDIDDYAVGGYGTAGTDTTTDFEDEPDGPSCTAEYEEQQQHSAAMHYGNSMSAAMSLTGASSVHSMSCSDAGSFSEIKRSSSGKTLAAAATDAAAAAAMHSRSSGEMRTDQQLSRDQLQQQQLQLQHQQAQLWELLHSHAATSSPAGLAGEPAAIQQKLQQLKALQQMQAAMHQELMLMQSLPHRQHCS